MVGRLRSFFLKGGLLKLPWTNSWFSLAAFSAALSAGLLISDCMPGKNRVGIPLPAIPIFEKPGSLTVNSSTPGATVQLDDKPAQPSPANFPKVPVGAHKVTVSAPGYDSAVRSVQIKEAAPASLDVNQLTRSSGGLDVISIPPHASFTLKGAGTDTTEDETGRTPMDFASLPADDYQLTVNSARNGSQTVKFQLPPHRTTTQTVDLVRAAEAANADPEVAKALLGQADASTLSDAGKKDYAESLKNEIQEYTKVGAFAQATSAINSLKALGQNTQAQEQHLTEASEGYQQKVASQVKDYISQGELGAARAKLKAGEESAPPQTADALDKQFSDKLGPYDQQVDSAIQTASSSAPSAGYDQLQALAQQHPDDVRITLAAAHQLTLQPPDRSRITQELARLKDFDVSNLPSDDSGSLEATIAEFQGELKSYDRFHAAVDAEAKLSSAGRGLARIAALEQEIARDEAAIKGASSVNRSVDHFTTGLFHTHMRVVDVSATQEEIDRDKQSVQQIKAQVVPKGTISDAQRNLDTFSATVPW